MSKLKPEFAVASSGFSALLNQETVVYVLVDDKPPGVFALADEIRPESYKAVSTLKEYSSGILISPAIGAVLMSLSTVVVAINAQLLKRKLV